MTRLNVEVHNTISTISKNQWNNVVEQSRLGSFFHRYEWLKAIEDGIGLNPRHIMVLKSGAPIGVFPNFITKIENTPFSRLVSSSPGFGGPLISTDENEVIDLMFSSISNICSGSIISHLIKALDSAYIRYGQYLEGIGYKPNLKNTRFIIDLNEKWENIKSNVGRGKKRKIKNAYTQNFEVKDEEINSININQFYEIYKRAMGRVNGVIHPQSFFNNLERTLSKRVKIFSAIVDGVDVGKHLYFIDDEQFSLHHFFSAVDESNFKYYPSELLHAHAIQWGIENGYKYYDFGGTSAHFNNGLFKFKEEFGGKAVPTLTWEKSYSRLRWSLFRTGVYLYKKIR